MSKENELVVELGELERKLAISSTLPDEEVYALLERLYDVLEQLREVV